jgi:phospholipase C
VRGPNGFLYEAAGRLDGADLVVNLGKDPKRRSVELEAHNPSDRLQTLTIAAGAYRMPPALTQPLEPHTQSFIAMDASANGHWYDIRVGCAEDPAFLRRFAGRLETGKPGVSDPAIGRRV